MNLPPCQHRGEAIGSNSYVCISDRIIHSTPHVASSKVCEICPYADQPNRGETERTSIPINQNCVYRGSVTKIGVCNTCGPDKGQRFDIYQCHIHGACSLTKKHSGIKSCLGCFEGSEETQVNWSYGITTVPERLDSTLPDTITSLARAGFDKPRLFVDGAGDPAPYQQFGLEVSMRYPRLRTAGNWVLSLMELYQRDPVADRYVIFQDDILACPNLREYLEKQQIPDKGYWNLYNAPQNEKRATGQGWYESNQLGKGALGLVFSRVGATTLLSQPYLIIRPQDQARGHLAIDGGIVTAMRNAGWKEYVHAPSLIQHTGVNGSTTHPGVPPHRVSDTFRDDFDPLTLLQQPVTV